MLNPSTFRPLRNKMLVSATSLAPDSTLFTGYSDAPRDYHPLEVPAYVRKRMIDFLECSYPIPPAYLESLIPASEVRSARDLYRTLKGSGMNQGEAVMAMGIFARPLFIAATFAVAIIHRTGTDCRCLAEVGDTVLIHETAGEIVDGSYRVINCTEVICGVTPETAAQAAAREAAASAARRLAFVVGSGSTVRVA